MKLVLASGNKGKLREFREMCADIPIVPFGELMEPFDIVEDGDSFAKNALIKAQTIYDKLIGSSDGPVSNANQYIVIADDSGISIPALDGEPGIYSARYAGKGANDKENLHKLITTLQTNSIKRTPAYYTAAIAIISARGKYVVHGWMYGDVIAQAIGDRGFGYDPMFIPEGYDETLGQLDNDTKSSISHRSKAMQLAKPIIDILTR